MGAGDELAILAGAGADDIAASLAGEEKDRSFNYREGIYTKRPLGLSLLYIIAFRTGGNSTFSAFGLIRFGNTFALVEKDQSTMANLIIGCGYLGRRVADLWLRQGKHVAALTRNRSLMNCNPSASNRSSAT